MAKAETKEEKEARESKEIQADRNLLISTAKPAAITLP